MSVRHFLLVSFASLVCCAANAVPKQTGELKPRVVIMTDIGPADVEPDDNESMVRLLSYADRFEIEAICTTVGWNCDPYPTEWAEYLKNVVEAYKTDVQNLMRRSGQSTFLSLEEENGKQYIGYWPSYDYISSRTMMGSQRAGIDVIGDGNDSDGSNFLIKLVKEDDERPIWILSWGSSNTLAQALWQLKQDCTPDEFRKYVRKFRIYTITDQDMQWSMRMKRSYSSHMWMRKEFKDDLLFIWDESAWLNQNELGKQNWEKYVNSIQGKGEMGKVYPTFLWGVEGDTPSFLHVMPNGLNNPEEPAQVGWGGYHVYGISPDSMTYSWTNWDEPVKSISDAYEKRFYPDEFNDFAARMEWADKGTGNVNPIIIIGSNDKHNVESLTKAEIITVKAGKTIMLDASASYDPDGDNLLFKWWQQKEAGSYNMPVGVVGEKTPKAGICIPVDAAGKTVHVVCEVHDDGPYSLVTYKRVIISVK